MLAGSADFGRARHQPGYFAGPVQLWRVWHARREAAAIRNIIVEYRSLIFDAKDVPDPKDANVRLAGADEWRAVLCNEMLGEVGRTLDHWWPHLPLERRQSLLRALDWYPSGACLVAPPPRIAGHKKFLEIEPGSWPGNEMSPDQAREKFGKLEAVKRLKFPKVELSD